MGHSARIDQRVSELLHFDSLYVGEARSGHEYIFILKEDISGYVFLRLARKQTQRLRPTA